LRNILRIIGVGMSTIETNTRKIVARLRAEGWIDVGGSKHDKFEHSDRPDVLIIVPRHKQQSPGVARSIARLAGWN
jgi:predicted RNA binding protein YcfA (HicA-like mRNA interferase family)